MSNQSLEINIKTQYAKPNFNMSKKVKLDSHKMNELKKHYVSPYSIKKISNNVKL
jgi:hypothetical protein